MAAQKGPKVTSSRRRSTRTATTPVTSSSDRSTRTSTRPVTSSRNRSTRSTTKQITSAGKTAGKNPKVDNRIQRAKVSTATVTTGRGAAPDTRSADAKRWQQLNNAASASRGKASEPKPARPAPGNGNPISRAVNLGQADLTRRAQAQIQANARQAIRNMERTLRNARITRGSLGGLKAGVHGYIVEKVLEPRPTAPGTLTDAKQRGYLAKRPKPTPQEKAIYRSQEAKARAKNAQRKGSSFDDAFADARRAKVKTFTWRGKRYSTDLKK